MIPLQEAGQKDARGASGLLGEGRASAEDTR